MSNTIHVVNTKVIEETVELELPYYSKSHSYIHKVISQECVIGVNFSVTNPSIEVGSLRASIALNDTSTKTTEDEFWRLYNETRDRIYVAAISH